MTKKCNPRWRKNGTYKNGDNICVGLCTEVTFIPEVFGFSFELTHIIRDLSSNYKIAEIGIR